jgi:hypothetical protein
MLRNVKPLMGLEGIHENPGVLKLPMTRPPVYPLYAHWKHISILDPSSKSWATGPLPVSGFQPISKGPMRVGFTSERSMSEGGASFSSPASRATGFLSLQETASSRASERRAAFLAAVVGPSATMPRL